MHSTRFGIHMGVKLVLFVALAANAMANQQDDRLRPDMFLFKGRLVGVAFPNKMADGRSAISLQFSLDDPYAILMDNESRGAVVAVATDWKYELADVNQENYVSAIESNFPDGVHLGAQFLVTVNWPGVRGYELLDMRPATAESERAFLTEHHQYILDYRRYRHYGRVYVHLVRLQSALHSHKKMKLDYQADAEAGAVSTEWEQIINDKRRELIEQREWSIGEISRLIPPLEQDVSESTDELEVRTLGLMIRDTEEVLLQIRKFELE